MKEVDVCQCRKCGKLEVRRQDGYFPDGRNKRFINDEGKQWSGRACPGCVLLRVRTQVKERRQKAKNAETGTESQN
jgi:hypothetical protein